MATPIDMLTDQFLAWLDEAPRSYAETMEAWRTSCPRLSVWEDATLGGLVTVSGDSGRTVVLTEAGRDRLMATKASATRASMPPSHQADPNSRWSSA